MKLSVLFATLCIISLAELNLIKQFFFIFLQYLYLVNMVEFRIL